MHPPAEYLCPMKDPAAPLPTSVWIPCDQYLYVDTTFPAGTTCESALNATSPLGVYDCVPGYNGKNIYRSTVNDVTWEIKWEKSQEFGGAVIGNLGGYGHKAKWTFASKTASSMP